MSFDPLKLLEMASTFTVFPKGNPSDFHSFAICVERRWQSDGSIKWVITEMGGQLVFSKSEKHFIHDGFNSSRTDVHKADTRFSRFDSAMVVAEQLAVQYEKCIQEWKEGKTTYVNILYEPDTIKIPEE